MKPRTIQAEADELAALNPPMADLIALRAAVAATLRRLCDDPATVLLPDIDPVVARRRLKRGLSVLETVISQRSIQPLGYLT